MPELLERPISTLPEFCQATCELGMASARRRLWFRGVHNVGYPLVPRLYRSDSEAADLLALEEDMLAEFRSRSRALLTTEMASDWEHLFVMQHYGVPTRLLDWSENALFAPCTSLSRSPNRRATRPTRPSGSWTRQLGIARSSPV
jgi:FRG domain